ncbi:MAG: hypothetical protein MSA20_01690 [Bacteroidales bacterium]|nr:hypothetical protein [Bacteroidales bacterium]
MKNPYISQVLSIQEEIKKQLPYGLETTADLLLEFMSRSKDEQQRDTAAFIKASKKMPEMVMVFDFAMSLLQHDITPIRESIYDTGIDGIKELNDHSADKSGIDESHKGNAKAYNFFNWLVLRLPAKEEMKKFGLIY